jgi:hypothetical protein
LIKAKNLDWTESFNIPKIGEKRLTEYETKVEAYKNYKGAGALTTLAVVSTTAIASIYLMPPSILYPALETATHIGNSMQTAFLSSSDTLVSVSADTSKFVTVNAQNAAGDGFDRLISKVLWITDKLMSGVIIFSGISWMFGNRTKAIELLFGAGVGYIIVRHHEDIKNFFALL